MNILDMYKWYWINDEIRYTKHLRTQNLIRSLVDRCQLHSRNEYRNKNAHNAIKSPYPKSRMCQYLFGGCECVCVFVGIYMCVWMCICIIKRDHVYKCDRSAKKKFATSDIIVDNNMVDIDIQCFSQHFSGH